MWKCYNAVVRQLSSIAISKSPVRFSSCSRLYMLRHAHASVAAYCCWDGVSISASQLDKRWLLDIFFAEEDGIYFLQASVLDTECADIFLQFDTGRCSNGARLCSIMKSSRRESPTFLLCRDFQAT